MTRDVLDRLYVGSPIGQGVYGDEDNGEMSAWYVFNALGFYPYSLASGEYVIGSPLFDKVTVHLDNGKDLTVGGRRPYYRVLVRRREGNDNCLNCNL